MLGGGGQKSTNFAVKSAIFPEKVPFLAQNLPKSPWNHVWMMCWPIEWILGGGVQEGTNFARKIAILPENCHFKPQKPLEMTIKAHSAVLNVHFYHHLHLPTSFLGYRTQFKLIKFNSVLIVPNSLKKRHFEPQKPLEMAMKPHSAVLNVKFYYYSWLSISF